MLINYSEFVIGQEIKEPVATESGRLRASATEQSDEVRGVERGVSRPEKRSLPPQVDDFQSGYFCPVRAVATKSRTCKSQARHFPYCSHRSLCTGAISRRRTQQLFKIHQAILDRWAGRCVLHCESVALCGRATGEYSCLYAVTDRLWGQPFAKLSTHLGIVDGGTTAKTLMASRYHKTTLRASPRVRGGCGEMQSSVGLV